MNRKRTVLAIGALGGVALVIGGFGWLGAAPAGGQLSDCGGSIPDPNSLQFCGGESNTCEDAQVPTSCTGTKKDRNLVTQDCHQTGDSCLGNCGQATVWCWREYMCDWDYSEDTCNSELLVDSSTTMAKIVLPCLKGPGCNQIE